MGIGKLELVPLKELWEHEAHNFTHWLADNLDYLSEILGFEITFSQREAPVGPFYVDILAEKDSGASIVAIENQLGKTDHDHLGKLITYMSNLEAKTAIWISSNPQPEHEKAVHWLNELLPFGTAVYLIKLEAYKIGSSAPAPKFTIVAGPTKQATEIGMQKKDIGARHQLRLEFWQFLLDKIKQSKATNMFNGKNPTLDNWMSSTAGKNINYDMIVRYEDSQVDIYIDTGNLEKNKGYFDQLYNFRVEIERSFGAPIEWLKNENKRACRIRYIIPGLGVENKEHWDELSTQLIRNIIKFKNVFQPYIDNLV